jgi:transcriptional antiterminator NusG
VTEEDMSIEQPESAGEESLAAEPDDSSAEEDVAEALAEASEDAEETAEAEATAKEAMAAALGIGDEPATSSEEVTAAFPVEEEEAPTSISVSAPVLEVSDEDEEAASEVVREELENMEDPDDGIKRRWYALHAYSGQEANVKRNLLAEAEQLGLNSLLSIVFVPMEEVVDMKSGEKKISKRKFFPGYVLVRLPEHPEHYADLWHLIKETPGVSGFIGGSRTSPTPLAEDEVQAIIEEVRGERERPKPKVMFELNERVKIIDGPFANFLGNIDSIDADRGKIKVLVEIFERLTSVEVEFWQIEKI